MAFPTKKKMKKVIGIFIIILLNINLFSQSLISPEVIASSGGDFKTSAGTQFSWTLGEIVAETVIGSRISITQGFQQHSYSFEVPPPESVKENDFFSDFSIYPNPFSAFFKVKLKIKNKEKLKLELFTLEGKKILIQNLNNGENFVFLPYCSSGALILNIINENKTITSCKLIRDSK